MKIDYYLVAGVGTVVAMVLLAATIPGEAQQISVAFLGNSITFVNDTPRFLEALSNGSIQQNSCLHGSLNLMTLFLRGNGMYNKWGTPNAVLATDWGESNTTIYDFGACSIPQLLLGTDPHLQSGDGMIDDGKNPCFQSSAYSRYLEEKYDREGPPSFDFVVMNDQTRQPVRYLNRRKSLLMLSQVYTPLFQMLGATPVFLVTHGYFPRQQAVAQVVGDIPTFTSHLYYAYRQYQSMLYRKLGVMPKMADVGLAFLTVYEEDYDLWQRLFLSDGFHPSTLGSYLIGCVLYATLFDRMPPYARAVYNTEQLWARARRMHLNQSQENYPFPTVNEAAFLYKVCFRVVIVGHIPHTLLTKQEVEELQSQGNWYHTATDDGWTVPDDDAEISFEYNEDFGYVADDDDDEGGDYNDEDDYF